MDSLVENGVYTVEGDTSIVSGSTVYGALLVLKGSWTYANHMGALQIIFDSNSLGLLFRQQWMVGTWTSWYRISLSN